MLHEILLSLSGYQSDIFEKAQGQLENGTSVNEFTSAPERAMLEVLGNIASLHIEIKQSTARIASAHPSPICRGVASTISDTHLAAFRKKVVQVEASILQRDAAFVGGYGIVPLSTIVGEFKPWLRRLEWLKAVTECALRQEEKSETGSCTGSAMIDHLHAQTHTGYSDLEDMATALLVAAQKLWMRSVATWILYGQLPAFGSKDFFIQKNSADGGNGGSDETVLVQSLLPRFITESTADNILSIGNAVVQIRTQKSIAPVVSKGADVISLLPKHLKILESLQYPLNTWILQQAIDEIDLSISQNALANVLPLTQITDLLEVLHSYLLLSEGEFATGLIEHAAEKLMSRQTSTITKPVRKVGRVDDLAVKDAELAATLTKTWDDLAVIQVDDLSDSKPLEMGRKLLMLRSVQDSHQNVLPLATLMPMPVVLDISLPKGSGLRLFLHADDIHMYGKINAFLLSMRRSVLHLSQLWKLTPQRRCHPTPIGPPMSASAYGQKALSLRRLREGKRAVAMRQHWSSASKTLYVLNEVASYFHGEVIRNSWDCFQDWLHEGTLRSRPGSSRSQGSRPGTASSAKTYQASTRSRQMNDPRTLARGHRRFLHALESGLMIKNAKFVAAFKELLNTVDHYVALFSRLSTIWQGLDLQEDEGIVDAFSNYKEDERAALAEMGRSRTSLEELIAELVERLKEAETERTSDGLVADVEAIEIASHTFVPWKIRNLDRLIMKLDYLAGGKEDMDQDEKLIDDDDE